MKKLGKYKKVVSYRTKRLEFGQCACVVWDFIPPNLHDTRETKRMTGAVFAGFDQFAGLNLQYNRLLWIVPKIGIRICPFHHTNRTGKLVTILCGAAFVLIWLQFLRNLTKIRTTQTISNFTNGMENTTFPIISILFQHGQQKAIDCSAIVVVVATDYEQIKVTDQTVLILFNKKSTNQA